MTAHELQRVEVIDRWMPAFGVRTFHRIQVSAPATRTFAAIRDADLARALPVRALLFLRPLPSALSRGTGGLRRLGADLHAPLRLSGLEGAGFVLIDEAPGRELVLGLEGRFWTPTGGIAAADPGHFRAPIPAGAARVLWSFSVEPSGAARCSLSTETRVAWSDPSAGRSFRAYWALVRPWSGLTRRWMLRSIRTEAEAGVRPGPAGFTISG